MPRFASITDGTWFYTEEKLYYLSEQKEEEHSGSNQSDGQGKKINLRQISKPLKARA